MKKRLISLILTTALLLSMLCFGGTAAHAEEQHSIWPEMTGVLSARYTYQGGQVTRVEVGDVFQLELWINGIDPYAISVPVNWDPTVVTMVNDVTGKPVTSGLKSSSQIGDGFRAGSACYDESWDENGQGLYWNGDLVFTTADTDEGYPYVDNENGHCHVFFMVNATTAATRPQMFLSLTFKVLRKGDPGFHFATAADRVHDPASTEGMMLAFKNQGDHGEQGVVASRLQLPALYVISSWQEQTPTPADPGIGVPWDINAPAPAEGETVERPSSGSLKPIEPVSVRPPDIKYKNATHSIAYPYQTPVYTQAVIRTTTSSTPVQSDNYMLPSSYLAKAINKLLGSADGSAIVVRTPDDLIDKDEYIISFSCSNLDDLAAQRAAMLYFETPYGYVGVDAGTLYHQAGDKATVTLGTTPVTGGIKLTVQVDGETVSGFSSPVFLLILPYEGEEAPRVVSSTVFGKASENPGNLPLSVSHWFPDGRTVSFLTPSAGTYMIETAAAQSFTDVPDTFWGYAAISRLSEAGIVSGKTEDRFVPNGLVTRAELAKLLVCTLSTYQTVFNMKFQDVRERDWFYPYVGSAYRVGIAKGESDTAFKPNNNVTRQDMAVMAYRGLNLLGVQLTPVRPAPDFTDADQISGYAVEAVTALYRAGILNGMGDGSFQPRGTATRAQAAQLINGLYEIASTIV